MNDASCLSKADLKDLIGIKEGIRLFTRLSHRHQQQTTAAKVNVSTANINSLLQRSYHKSSASISISVPRSPSLNGLCRMDGCHHSAIAVCSVNECCAPLCVWHSSKSLLTGFVYCPRCEEDTWEGKVRQYYNTATETATSATNTIIEHTAKYTIQGRRHNPYYHIHSLDTDTEQQQTHSYVHQYPASSSSSSYAALAISGLDESEELQSHRGYHSPQFMDTAGRDCNIS